MQRWLHALAIAVALVPVRSAADDSSPIGVLAVEIAGDAAPELRPRVADSIARGLAETGRDVVELNAVMSELAEAPELMGCTSTACLERIAERVGASEFVRARLRADGANYTLVLERFAAEGDKARVHELKADCTVCTKTELFAWVRATSAELLVPERTGSAAIVIETEPPGATVEIGGRAIGTGPTEAKLPLGEHEITARLEGYDTATRTIRVEEGAPGPHEVGLVLVPRPQSLDNRPAFGRWKWVAAGGAAASLATSAVLLALDGNPTCEPEPPQTQCPRERDGMTPGLVGLGLGVALGGVSGWMFYQDSSGREATITAGPGAAGGAIRITF